MSFVVQLLHLSLETRCNSTAEGPSSPRPCFPDFFKKPPVWNRRDARHRRILFLPTITTAEMWIILGNLGDCMKGRVRFIMTAITPGIRSCIPVNLLGGTSNGDSPPEISLTCGPC